MNVFDYKAAVQSLNFFAQKEGGSISKMKALKLIWLSNRYHVQKYARLIFEDEYFALRKGPILSATLNLANNKCGFIGDPDSLSYRDQYINPVSNKELVSIGPFDENLFSESDIECMEEVYSEFGKYNPETLSEISHKFPEWERFKSELQKRPDGRCKIEMDDLFDNPKGITDSVFNLDKSHIELSKEFYHDRKAMHCLL